MLTDEQLKALGPTMSSASTDDIITITGDDTVIDLSGYGAATETITFSDSMDTITLNGAVGSGIGTITLPSYTTSYTGATYSTVPSGGYTISSGASWAPQQPTVNIDTNGIDIKAGGDIKVDGKSLKEFMTKMEQRLSILVPDPEKLEKFEALKKAYEHYKTMEALCFPKDKEEKEN